MSRGRLVHGAVLLLVWLAVTVTAGLLLFLGSSRTVVLASHEAELRPTLDGYVVLHTGPVLPDLRVDSGSRVGADVVLGKTEAGSLDGLVERYAFIASQPEGQVVKVRDSLADMAYTSFAWGAAIGLLPVGVWLLVGPARRRELARRALTPPGLLVGVAVALLVTALVNPGAHSDPEPPEQDWITLQEFLGPDVPVPEEAEVLEVSTDVTASGSRRLVQSAVDTYERSRVFYADAAEAAADIDVRQPLPGETVVAVVSDRHDNIGMDAVARAIADAGGATAVFDAGDDTSTGQDWEAFSLDSVTAAFSDLDRYGVAGNHDEGDFVADYLAGQGWTMLDGTVVEGPGGATLLGVNDPRSSGLGNWRDETGLSFEEVGTRLADEACSAPERVSTILVHDADLGAEALARGCADLVIGGHLHLRLGPDEVVGENGAVGYTFTTGTTGGAAYAIALGSKPRREASVALVTYADGRPVGLQSVVVQTNGVIDVLRYDPLTPAAPPSS